MFHLDTLSLAGTDVGNDSVSSLQIVTTLPAHQSSIRSTSRLTEEHQTDSAGELISVPVYRSIITVPPTTGDIDVWATEEITINVAGRDLVIDPVKPARFKPNVSGKLIINIEPNALGKAALMVRTSGMLEKERFFVFPDSDVHTKLLAMDNDTIWDNKGRLGVDSSFTKADAHQVQSAIQALSSTVPSAARSLSHGTSRDRLVVTDKMPYKAWALELGGSDRAGAALFRPAAVAELSALNSSAIRVDEQSAQGLFDFIEKTDYKICSGNYSQSCGFSG